MFEIHQSQGELIVDDYLNKVAVTSWHPIHETEVRANAHQINHPSIKKGDTYKSIASPGYEQR